MWLLRLPLSEPHGLKGFYGAEWDLGTLNGYKAAKVQRAIRSYPLCRIGVF